MDLNVYPILIFLLYEAKGFSIDWIKKIGWKDLKSSWLLLLRRKYFDRKQNDGYTKKKIMFYRT